MNHNHWCMPHNAAHCLQQRSSYPPAPAVPLASCSVPLCPSAPSNAPQCPAVPHGGPTAETAVLLSRRSASQQSAPRCSALYTTVLLSAPATPSGTPSTLQHPAVTRSARQRPAAPRSAPQRPAAPRSAPQRPAAPRSAPQRPAVLSNARNAPLSPTVPHTVYCSAPSVRALHGTP